VSDRAEPPKAVASLLAPTIEKARAALRGAEARTVCQRAGAELISDRSGLALAVPLLGRRYGVRFPSLEAVDLDQGKPCSDWITSLLLLYLSYADGTPEAGQWIAFHELPGGETYNQAFQGYSGNVLARVFGHRAEAFTAAAQSLGGETVALGDLAFAWHVLPRVGVAAVLWLGDDEFAAEGHVLFDASAPHYLPSDGLAVLGGWLVGQLVRRA
jgi:hypothetical protein